MWATTGGEQQTEGSGGDSWWQQPAKDDVQLQWIDDSTTQVSLGADEDPIEMKWTYEEEWPEWFDESTLDLFA